MATEQVNGSSASTAKALSSAANFSLATSNASASSSIASAGNSSATNTNSVASKMLLFHKVILVLWLFRKTLRK